MVVGMGSEMIEEVWGTWEELLLGGAVLRHGTRAWNLVASELRGRTVCPYNTFTPEACKSKYDDLQQRYAGCTAWYEELRKKRMAELRLALELSEGSIGSLESKLETLKSEKGDDCLVNYVSSQTKSPATFRKSDEFGSSCKETSKEDGLSAGSFTQEARTNWSPECQPAPAMTEETENKLETSHSFDHEKISSIENLTWSFEGGHRGMTKRRRGIRKRKECSSKDVKEGSVGETVSRDLDYQHIAFWSKENLTGNSEDCGSSGADGFVKDRREDLVRIFNSVLENKSASIFCHRLDSQKRGRYKKLIRQHMDLDLIRSRISSRSITALKELFRDLLLLTNNALIFYSKTTREHKSALALRDFVMKMLQQNIKPSSVKTASKSFTLKTPACKHTVKTRNVHLTSRKSSGKVSNSRNVAVRTLNVVKRQSNAADSPRSVKSLVATKKGHGRPSKAGHGNGNNQVSVTQMNGRKRVRSRFFSCKRILR